MCGNWPGLGAGKLLENRGLAPTLDGRDVAMGLLIGHLGLPASAPAQVFPGAASASLQGLLRAGAALVHRRRAG